MAVQKKIPSSVNKLPLHIVIELKRRLRAGSYEQKELVLWLNGLGHNITKSALSRFAVRLRNGDEQFGIDPEIMAAQDVDVAALFEELAQLRTREAEIIAQLKSALAVNPR